MQKLPFALIGVAVIVLAVFLFNETTRAPGEEVAQNTYTSAIHGFSFSYPDGYVLAEPAQDTVTLVREEDAVPPQNGEGPTGITVETVPTSDSLVAWVTNTPSSNFALGDGMYVSTTVDGVDAIRYSWSGLYEGETIALSNRGKIILISVTRLSPNDHTAAYERVLDSFEITAPSMQ